MPAALENRAGKVNAGCHVSMALEPSMRRYVAVLLTVDAEYLPFPPKVIRDTGGIANVGVVCQPKARGDAGSFNRSGSAVQD